MRVLHADAGGEMRGGQWQTLLLVERQRQTAELLARSDGPLLEIAESRGVQTGRLGALRLATRSSAHDLVHAHDARAHTIAAVASRRPFVVTRRVAFAPGAGFASRWKYDRAAHFIAISGHVRDVLTKAGVPADRVSVVYDGVVVPEREASGDRIVALASADPLKGGALMRAAAELGGFHVHFSSDLGEDLPRAAVFLYITESEGLGSAALLAMAHGVPVVASRVGGLPEAVEDGRTGVLTDNDPGAIAKAVKRALEARVDMAAAARERVLQRFTADRMADGTAEVYRRVLQC